MGIMAYVAPLVGIIALGMAYSLAAWISKVDAGTDRMKEIAGYIAEGAMAFLKREYKTMIFVIVVLCGLLCVGIDPITGVLFVVGALFSVLAGYFGMKVATMGNVRTANAAREGESLYEKPEGDRPEKPRGQ